MHTSRLAQFAAVLIVLAAGIIAYAASIQWSDGDGNSGTFLSATWPD
ncbi:MAG: hypothetical protein N3G20_07115 [Verrucomicrobiae bacterium]|nr:hypothetical protein [Verrucomicrobiae bacterium]